MVDILYVAHCTAYVHAERLTSYVHPSPLTSQRCVQTLASYGEQPNWELNTRGAPLVDGWRTLPSHMLVCGQGLGWSFEPEVLCPIHAREVKTDTPWNGEFVAL